MEKFEEKKVNRAIKFAPSFIEEIEVEAKKKEMTFSKYVRWVLQTELRKETHAKKNIYK